jgi:hypothetical protein
MIITTPANPPPPQRKRPWPFTPTTPENSPPKSGFFCAQSMKKHLRMAEKIERRAEAALEFLWRLSMTALGAFLVIKWVEVPGVF